MVSERVWQSFRSDCIEAMERFQSNEIKMVETDAYLGKYEKSDVDGEVLEFIWNTISHIDADSEGYAETLKLLKEGASESDLREYMDRP